MSDIKKKSDRNEDVDDTRYSMETHLIHGKNITNKWDYAHHVTAPISSSTTFRLDSVERGAAGFMQFAHTKEFEDVSPIFIYDRLGEPNKDMLEEHIAYVERGEMAVSFASGMGAISGVLGILTKSGDEIITHKTLYGCTISLFTNWYPRYNIKVTNYDLTDISKLNEAITPQTKVIYFETPANPNMDIIDIEALSEMIHEINKSRGEANQIQIVVDNTFATSYCQRPIEHGADFTVHSLTKGMGGFGTDMGGIVVGRKEFRDMLLLYRKDFGAVLNTKSAWSILTYGLPSLPLRQKHVINTASQVAEYLDNHPKIERVNYPGLKSFKYHKRAQKQMIDFDGNFAPGGLLYFIIKGKDAEESKKNGAKFMDYIAEKAYTLTLAVSLGHTRSLVEHPASMTHSVVPADKLAERGIDAGGVRLAFGLEKSSDIIADIEKALQTV